MRGSSSYENLSDALGTLSGTPSGSPVPEFSTSVEGATQSGKVYVGTVEFPLYPYNPSEATQRQIDGMEMRGRKNSGNTSSATTSYQNDFLLPPCTEDNPHGIIVHLDSYWDLDDREAIKIKLESALEVEVKLYRFVITQAGVLVCGSNEVGLKYDHSALRARWSDEPSDNAVLAAGEMGFDRNGKLRFVCNKTGHFQVPADTLDKVLYPALLAHGYTKESIAELYVEKFNGDRDDHDTDAIKTVDLQLPAQGSDTELELRHFFLAAREVAAQEAGDRAKKKQGFQGDLSNKESCRSTFTDTFGNSRAAEDEPFNILLGDSTEIEGPPRGGVKRKYTGGVTCFGSNSSSSIGNSLLLPPGGAALLQPRRHPWEEALPSGNSFSLRAGHASTGSLFGDSLGGEGFSLDDERGQGASNQSKAASGSLFDPPSLR